MNERDRDSAMERLLRETLASEPAVESPACLDPEMLAAWSEGVLPDQARASAEAHAANCARCQAMLAVMARTLPAASASTSSPVRKWLMMLSPALAAAAALVVWFSVDDGSTPSRTAQTANARAVEEHGAPASATAPALPSRAETEAGRLAHEKVADGEKRRASQLAPVKKEVPFGAANKPAEAAGERKVERDREAVAVTAESPRIKAGITSPSAPPPPVAEPAPADARQQQIAPALPIVAGAPVASAPQQPAQSQTAANQQSQAANQALADAAKPIDRVDQLPRSSDAAAAGPGYGGGYVGGRAGAAARTEAAKSANEMVARQRITGSLDVYISSPNPSVQWQVMGGRTIRQSIDGGASWATQYAADSSVTMTAGVAPSATVCWIVGRAGAVFVTTDGRIWKRVAFPETIDLESVTASDGRTATVVAAGSRIFVTSDGGLTWSRRQP
jgi:hypothetical protein